MAWALFLPLAAAVLAADLDHPQAPSPPVIVIDAGHGGRNAGAPGANGRHEKEITLAVAIRLDKHLRARGIRTVMTRTRDDYLTLRERTRIANQHRGDLFISIHANASGVGASRGYETHVLSPYGANVEAPALRGFERVPRLGLDSEISAVLDAVESHSSISRAADIAADIQMRLAKVRGAKHNRGIKQDSHHVLLGAAMPAVLVEIGFVDHPIEGPELFLPIVQERIAEALAESLSKIHLR